MFARTTPTLVLVGALALSACADDGSARGTQTIAVIATDDACSADATTAEAGTLDISVRNDGTVVTEVYVYAEGDRVVGEVENVTPGLTRTLQVTVGGGDYEIACKPGQTGDGIRTSLTVTGEALDTPEATREVEFSGVDYSYEALGGVQFEAGDVVKFEMLNDGIDDHEARGMAGTFEVTA